MKKVLFTALALLFSFSCLVAQNCPDLQWQNMGNGGENSCPGVGTPTPTATYPGLVSPYNSVPTTSKTGNIRLGFTSNPGFPPVIVAAYNTITGAKIELDFGPPSTYGASHANQINYCIYGGSNLGTKYMLEMLNGATGQLFTRCTYNGTGAAKSSPVVTFNSNGNACLNSAKEIQVTVTNYSGALTFTWQLSTDNGASWSNITAGATYSISNTTPTSRLTIASGSVSHAMNGYQYRCMVDDASGGATISSPLTLSTFEQYTWIGGISNAWNTAGNWACGTIPPANANVTIINAPPFSPQIPAATTITVNNLIFGTGSSVDLNNGTFVINGVITNNPVFRGSSTSSLTLNGVNTRTINFTNPANARLANLTINNASSNYTITGNTDIFVSLNVTNGSLNTGTDTLTLKSTSITNTAVVGPVGGTISGRIRVERFIPASNRAFRLISPGVTTTSTIRANWQEGVNQTEMYGYPNAGGTPTNPFAGYGVHITGSKVGANGFDATVTGNPSTYTFNHATQAWVPISNTNVNTLSATVPYCVSVRGSRSTDMTTNTPAITTTTIRATGTLTTGPVTYSGILAQNNLQYSLVANPYWAQVDWDGLSRTNVGTTYWIWDPTLAGTNGKGQYASYTVGSGPSGGGAISRFIQPGQAFFIRNTGTSPSLGFVEANKNTGASLTATFRTQAAITGRYVTKLYLKENFVNNLMADAGAIVLSNNFSNSVDEEDATKMNTGDESLSFLVGNTALSLNGIPVPAVRDTVFVQLKNLGSTQYTLQITGKDFMPNTDYISAHLYDYYLNTATPINNNGHTNVEFSIDNNPASKSEGRFIIVISSVAPLPVTLSNIKAISKNNGAEVEWTVENEINMDSYTVEHSTNGLQFSTIGSIKASGVSFKTYNLLHNNPVSGANYYRVKSIDKSGDVHYTKIVKLNFGKSNLDVTIFPNPIKDNIINLQFNGEKGIYKVIITNKAGQETIKKDIIHNGGIATHKISAGNLLSQTSYHIQISGNGVSEVLQVIKL